MRAVALTSAKGGIQRLRTKASVKGDSLFDQVNCYTTQANSVVPRPGLSSSQILPPGTIGLTYFAGEFVVFADHIVNLTGIPGYRLEVLTYAGTESGATLKQIHFAEPFLRVLYVAAEWSTGEVFHYWLQSAEAWQADHVYGPLAIVQPTTANGFTYRANRIGEPAPVWQAGVARAVGDRIEPTVFNGFAYECVEAIGAPPRSGATEPTWPTSEDAVVVEEADVALTPPAPPPQQPPPYTPPPRYDNPGGGGPRSPQNPVGTQIEN